MRFRIYLLLLLFAFGGCRYNDFDALVLPDYEQVLPNTTIGYVTSQYKGSTLNINDDIVIAGIVTADDRSGNFYRSFIIQDDTGAVEVRAGMFDLHNLFPRGRRVTVRARGLVLGSYNGVPQLGLRELESQQVGYIANRYYPDGHLLPQNERGLTVAPHTLNLNELDDGMCGLLVRIERLIFIPATEEEHAYTTWAERGGGNGYRVFGETSGTAQITVTTSGYASFAAHQLPRGRAVTLTGILMRGNTDTARNVYMLKLRGLEDVAE